MKYEEAIEYMEGLPAKSRERKGRREALAIAGADWAVRSVVEKLCEKLGNPQKELTFLWLPRSLTADAVSDESVSDLEITVGAVPAYLTSVLKFAGYKVGWYKRSGNLEYRERFQVKNKSISKKAFVELVERIKEICDDISAEDGRQQITSVDVEIAIALQFFRQQACQLVILDVDMADLIWILKSREPKCPKHICQDQNSIAHGCTEQNYIDLRNVEIGQLKKVRYGLEKQRFDYKEYRNMEISQAGIEQIPQAVLSLELLEKLQQQGYEIPEDSMRKGLREAAWKGGFTIWCRKPYFITNCIYRVEDAAKVAESVRYYFTNKRIILIIGMLRDGEWERIVGLTHGLAEFILTVAVPGNKSTVGSYELATEMSKEHPNVSAVDSVEEALEVSSLLAGKENVIIALGPDQLLGRLVQSMEKRQV